MIQSIKDKLRLIPRTVCFKCQSKRSYTNPMERCFECREKFCYDHIHCSQFKDEMSSSDEFRSICEECKIKHKYLTV